MHLQRCSPTWILDLIWTRSHAPEFSGRKTLHRLHLGFHADLGVKGARREKARLLAPLTQPERRVALAQVGVRVRVRVRVGVRVRFRVGVKVRVRSRSRARTRVRVRVRPQP